MTVFDRQGVAVRPHPVAPSRLRSTRTAVLALLILVVVLPAVTGLVTYLRARTLIVHEIQTGQHAAAKALAHDVEAVLSAAESVAAAAARGHELTVALEGGTQAEVEAALRSAFDTLPIFRSFAVVDGSGAVVAFWPRPLTTPLDEVATATSERAFRPRPRGDDAIMPLRFPATPGTALVAELSFDTALSHVTTFRFGETGTGTLVDGDAIVLLAGAEQRRNRSLSAPVVVALAEHMEPGQARYYAPLLRRRNIATFEPIPGRDMGILVDMAESEAFGPTIRLAWLVVASILLIALVGMLISWLVGRRLATSERTLQSLRDAAEQQALTDPLTGLANRRAFDEDFAAAFAEARASGSPLTVTMFDLNRFKLLNDTRGHAAGDAALRAVATEMRSMIRTDDLAARLGGDEFVVLQRNCAEPAAHRVAARITDAVASLGLLCAPAEGATLTVASGTAELAGHETAAELLAAADVNLYRAKEQQRALLGAAGGRRSAAGTRPPQHTS